MQSFKRIPVRSLPPGLFYRHIAVVCSLGLVLIVLCGVYAFWLATASGMRDAQQEGVHVQMALSRIGQEYAGLGKPMVTDAGTGTLSDETAQETLAAASEKGTIHLYAFDAATMQATKFDYDDGGYFVSYDAECAHPWTVTSHAFGFVQTY
jgi:hypothetical protein